MGLDSRQDRIHFTGSQVHPAPSISSGVLSWEAERLTSEANHFPSFSAEVKCVRRYISPLTCVCMVWCFVFTVHCHGVVSYIASHALRSFSGLLCFLVLSSNHS
jgi:hypothetical protein